MAPCAHECTPYSSSIQTDVQSNATSDCSAVTLRHPLQQRNTVTSQILAWADSSRKLFKPCRHKLMCHSVRVSVPVPPRKLGLWKKKIELVGGCFMLRRTELSLMKRKQPDCNLPKCLASLNPICSLWALFVPSADILYCTVSTPCRLYKIKAVIWSDARHGWPWVNNSERLTHKHACTHTHRELDKINETPHKLRTKWITITKAAPQAY